MLPHPLKPTNFLDESAQSGIPHPSASLSDPAALAIRIYILAEEESLVIAQAVSCVLQYASPGPLGQWASCSRPLLTYLLIPATLKLDKCRYPTLQRSAQTLRSSSGTYVVVFAAWMVQLPAQVLHSHMSYDKGVVYSVCPACFWVGYHAIRPKVSLNF